MREASADPYDVKQPMTAKHITNKNFSLRYKIGKYDSEATKNRIDKISKNTYLPSDTKAKAHQRIVFDKNNWFNVEEQKDDLHHKPRSNKISQVKKQKDHLRYNLSILDRRLDYIMNW